MQSCPCADWLCTVQSWGTGYLRSGGHIPIMADRRRAFPNIRAPLTPEVLASTIRISTPNGIVAVQGIAKSVSEPRSYGGRVSVYGELALGDALGSFVVPVERSPREGQPVITEGHLRFKLFTRSNNGSWRGDWKVMLICQWGCDPCPCGCVANVARIALCNRTFPGCGLRSHHQSNTHHSTPFCCT